MGVGGAVETGAARADDIVARAGGPVREYGSKKRAADALRRAAVDAAAKAGPRSSAGPVDPLVGGSAPAREARAAAEVAEALEAPARAAVEGAMHALITGDEAAWRARAAAGARADAQGAAALLRRALTVASGAAAAALAAAERPSAVAAGAGPRAPAAAAAEDDVAGADAAAARAAATAVEAEAVAAESQRGAKAAHDALGAARVAVGEAERAAAAAADEETRVLMTAMGARAAAAAGRAALVAAVHDIVRDVARSFLSRGGHAGAAGAPPSTFAATPVLTAAQFRRVCADLDAIAARRTVSALPAAARHQGGPAAVAPEDAVPDEGALRAVVVAADAACEGASMAEFVATRTAAAFAVVAGRLAAARAERAGVCAGRAACVNSWGAHTRRRGRAGCGRGGPHRDGRRGERAGVHECGAVPAGQAGAPLC